MLDLQLSKNDERPFYLQIAEHLRYLIVSGTLRAGEKLPAVRKLADQLGINPATVVAAYRILNKEGLISQRHGSGAYVTDHKSLTEGQTLAVHAHPAGSGTADSIDFSGNTPPGALYPLPLVKGIIDEILDSEGIAVFQYQDAEGHSPLRAVWAEEFAKSWKQDVSLSNISVVSGAQQGIDLAVRLLVKRGDSVVLESPGYRGARDVLLANGASVVPVGMEEDGISIKCLEKNLKQRNIRALYINPVLHNPTTAVWSEEKCEKVAELARKHDFYIIEDDQFSDMLTTPFAPLASYAPDRVIYVKSYSKILFPGLRVAGLYVPKQLFERLVAMKRTADIASNGLMQRVLQRLLISGGYEQHKRDVRQVYSASMDLFEAFAAGNADLGLSWKRPQGGFNVWAGLPQGCQASVLAGAASRRGLLLSPEALFRNEGKIAADSHVRMSIGSADEKSLAEGLRRFAACVRDCV